MTTWFRRSGAPGFNRDGSVNLDRDPAPTVMAGGIAGGNTSQYDIFDDGEPPTMSSTNKPPYRVPSMEEIRATPWNGLSAISTFAGCGGSSTGYRMAGYRMLYANEFIPAARESYAANKAEYTYLDGRDIRQVTAEDLLGKINMKPGELDVFDGSPPCASFSTAGKRQKGWGEVRKYSDTEQRTDDLFWEYIRLIKGVQPKVIVAENVSGLIKGVAKGYFLEVLADLKAAGYRTRAMLLDAQWLGVPQMRQRIIFIGIREDLGIDPAVSYPAPFPYRYSVREACRDLPGWSTGGVAKMTVGNVGFKPTFGEPDVPSPTILAGGSHGGSGEVLAIVPGAGNLSYVRKSVDTFPMDAPMPTVLATSDQFAIRMSPDMDMSGYATGEEWDKLKPGEASSKYFQLVKTDPDGPVQTVTAAGGASPGIASVTHPFEKRKFTIDELKRIGSFPDDFQLLGTYAQQWERIGRSVPPLMMKAVAAAIRDNVFGGGRK